MKEEKFTPGKWEAVRDEKNERWQIQESDVNGLVLVEHTFDGEEAEANANLIAAAPDMYEALKRFMAVYSISGKVIPGMDETIELMKAALSKASPY